MKVRWERQTDMIERLALVVTTGVFVTQWEAIVLTLSDGNLIASVKRDGRILKSNYSPKTSRAAKLWARKTLKQLLPEHIANQLE